MQSLLTYRTAGKSFRLATRAVLVAGVVACLLSASPALAVKVTNMTTSRVVFYDDFETAPSVSSAKFTTYASLNHDLDADPDNGAYPGYWSVVEPDVISLGDRQGNIQVIDIDDATVGDPGRIQGQNYLRVGRQDSDSSPITKAVLASSVVSEETLRVELLFACYAPLSANGGVYLIGTTDGGLGDEILTSLTFSHAFNPDVRNHNGSTTSAIPGMTYDRGGRGTPENWTANWNSLTIDYTVGESEYTVTVNDVTATVPIRAAVTVVSVDAVRFQGHNGGSILYVDAAVPVPEPSAFALLGLGGLCLMWRRRHG